VTAIVPSDIVFLLSVPAATAGYQTIGVAGNSLGKFCSTTPISSTPYDNLFSDITGPENAADQVDYACVFVLNNTASGNTMNNTFVWLPTVNVVPGGSNQMLATDNIGITTKTSSSAQAATIASSVTAPAGISGWVPPSTTSAAGIFVGYVAPGQVFACWIQRTATNSLPLNNDGFNLEVDFDTLG
jgi:hypothetical protein